MSRRIGFIKIARPAVLAVGLLVIGGSALAQEKAAIVPDAQVEANVLKSLAGAPELSDQNITSTTVYGTVTLSGTVRDEPTRVLAETVASRAAGVKKVIDELTLGTGSSGLPTAQSSAEPRQNSDPSGSMATEPGQSISQQAANQGVDQNNRGPEPSQPPSGPPSQPNATGGGQQPPNSAPYRRYPSRNTYGPPPTANSEPYGAQQAGQAVVVPGGAMLRVRINQGLDSNHSQPGTTFDGVVVNDVVADGAVAIPRGATVQGMVTDTQASGALKGRGELALQLTQVILGGRTYPIITDRWSRVGADKTLQTVNSTIGMSAVGALIGAVAGGGAGAAIGAGVGGVAGLGASAASGRGDAFIPPEAILTFHLAQQAEVSTVSQAEMDRLAYGVPIGAQHLQRRPPPPPPPYYYGPGYYPRPYYPYPY